MADCSSGASEENPVEDIWAALLCESFRIESTDYMKLAIPIKPFLFPAPKSTFLKNYDTAFV